MSLATTSMYRRHHYSIGEDQQEMELAYPPSTSRRPRRRKRNGKKRSKHNNNSTSSSEEHSSSRRKKKTSSRRRKHHHQPPPSTLLPLPEPTSVVYRGDDDAFDTPQVLLWRSSSQRRRSNSTASSTGFDDEEEERSSPSADIFRRRHAAAASSKRQGPEEYQEEALDLLGPSGPKWYEFEYWKQRLTTKCCLPKENHARQHEGMGREPLIDYRPSYLGRFDDNVYAASASATTSPWVDPTQQHYYVMPWPQQPSMPQVSPLTTGSGMPLHGNSSPYYHPWQQHPQPLPQAESPQLPKYLPEPLPEAFASPIQANRNKIAHKKGRKGHHSRQSSTFLGTHLEVAQEQGFPDPMLVISQEGSSDPLDMESIEAVLPEPPAMEQDLQSISSLETSYFRTPEQSQPRQLVIPDTNTTTESAPTGSGALSSRIRGLRRSVAGSPRPGTKPPVAPPRRVQSHGSKHKVQVTNSTMASTALPPLPSPLPSPVPTIPSPSARDLTRSFSEASATTNGSRHRRGGTVCEFSFESTSVVQGTSKPQSRGRTSSLPMEVQIQVHYPSTSELHRPPIRMVDSKDSWGVSPPPAYYEAQLMEEDTPEGYISPLEEEQFTLLTTSPEERSVSPREAASTCTSDAYGGDVDSPQSESNPQDSLCGDGGDEENDPPKKFEETSPFAKLKEPPSIPPGESWMWQWVGCNSSDQNALITPTQSPASLVVVERQQEQQLQRRSSIKTDYLPKNIDLEEVWRSQHATSSDEVIALSGWVAFGMGDSLVDKLTINDASLERHDVSYLVAPSVSDKLWVSSQPNEGDSFDAIDLSGCSVEVQEISREHGRVVYIMRGSDIVCTILPVCLPEYYNGDGASFADGSLCFPEGDYLPDEQQYTTMHIMFALDALLKAVNKPSLPVY